MKKMIALVSGVALTAAFGASAFAASPDVYVVNFRNDNNTDSQVLDNRLSSALIGLGNVEHVVIDTSNAAKWEKGAHEAFDRDIVTVFNKWVGLPGFAAIVDAKSKRVIGCVNGQFDSGELASQIRRMAALASGSAYTSRASTRIKSTNCPPAYNVDPGGL